MTPKEKAKQLVSSFGGITYRSAAKQCALICVDEIIKSHNYGINFIDSEGNIKGQVTEVPYWQEVKKEIEKL